MVSVSSSRPPTHLERETPEAMPDAARFPWRAIGAAVCSMIVPGLGQALLGARRRGLAMIGITVVILAMALAFGPRDPLDALKMAVQPRYLAGALVADVALLGFRLFAVIDAYRIGRGEAGLAPRSTLMAVTLGLLLLITAAPHAVVGYYDLITYRFVTDVFDNKQAASNQPPPESVELSRPVRLNPDVTPAAPPTVRDDQRDGPGT